MGSSLWIGLALGCIWLVSDHSLQLFNGLDVTVVFAFFGTCVFGKILQLSSLYISRESSVTTLAVINNVKSVLLIFGAFVVYGEQLSLEQGVGMLVCFAGVTFYSVKCEQSHLRRSHIFTCGSLLTCLVLCASSFSGEATRHIWNNNRTFSTLRGSSPLASHAQTNQTWLHARSPFALKANEHTSS